MIGCKAFIGGFLSLPSNLRTQLFGVARSERTLTAKALCRDCIILAYVFIKSFEFTAKFLESVFKYWGLGIVYGVPMCNSINQVLGMFVAYIRNRKGVFPSTKPMRSIKACQQGCDL